MNYEKIGTFISKKRKEKQLTQKELAKLIGVTDKAVSKWERGLGCPDVSILEILSKELNVSILEILKGRMIENEVIHVTELNDYVKDTIIYSKEDNRNKLIKFFSNLIFVLIIIMVSLLLFININHIAYLNHNIENSLNKDNIININNDLVKIRENIKIISNNKGNYSDKDYQNIKSNLNKAYKSINIDNLLKLYNKKITMNDLYIIDCSFFDYLSISGTYKILINYDKNLSTYYDVFIHSYVSKVFLPQKSIYDNYKYELIDFVSNYSVDLNMNSRVENIIYCEKELLYLTQNIIEVGELNE